MSKIPTIKASKVERKRNANGGWDVVVHVPILALKKAVGDAKAAAIMNAHPSGSSLA